MKVKKAHPLTSQKPSASMFWIMKFAKIAFGVILGASVCINVFLVPHLNTLRKENISLGTQIQTLSSQLQKLESERQTLTQNFETEKKSLLSSIEILKTEIAGLKQEVTPSYKDDIRRLTEENRSLNKKLRDLYKLTSEKMSQINIAKISLEQTISDARQKIDDQWSNVDLGSINVGKSQKLEPQPKDEGRILSINNENDFVIVDFGSINYVKNNTKFSVEKDGQDVATLIALEIRDTMTACNIQDLVQGTKLEVNDLVRIRK